MRAARKGELTCYMTLDLSSSLRGQVSIESLHTGPGLPHHLAHCTTLNSASDAWNCWQELSWACTLEYWGLSVSCRDTLEPKRVRVRGWRGSTPAGSHPGQVTHPSEVTHHHDTYTRRRELCVNPPLLPHLQYNAIKMAPASITVP